MQRKKTREELLGEPYLNKSEIQLLLHCSRNHACKVYVMAKKLDQEQLKDMVIYDTKVRTKSVYKVTGTDFNLLSKQIQNAIND